LSTQDIEKEIFACQAAVRAITGREMRLIRPPGARFGRKIESVARKFGMKVVLYSESCSKLEGTTEDKIIEHVIHTVSPGSIILMHNLDRVTLRALPDIIDKLRAQGYNFVTL
jgi:peptidoglycan/xylan/chitin deacetylase (PgdA/CDA1 family)